MPEKPSCFSGSPDCSAALGRADLGCAHSSGEATGRREGAGVGALPRGLVPQLSVCHLPGEPGR